MKSPAELTELFRDRGLKVTPQRQCIFRTLHGNEVHPTAESVYAAASAEMPTISLKTVYQTLNDLASMGEIQQLDLGTGSTRFDPNVEGHHHLVCVQCGKVRDLYVDARVRVPADQLGGFTVGTTEVVIRGLCGDCSSTPMQGEPHHG
ncbi:MAG: Fur family transcriptional regulator, peroxide stress response regulator [Actinomycetota bacterium]|nr:Fur family transcriptional regulator, peroxide stress response regulator [Actinomycetota bacterium]